MNSEKKLVQINPEEYGVPSEIAKNIQAQFQPMLDKMVELEIEYNEVLKLDLQDPDTARQARELRHKYVKVRTGTAAIHKEQKSFYLNGGKFVDGWKNAQIFASQGIEDKLEAIERHQENLEKQRKLDLHNSRMEKILPYIMNPENYDFSEMQDDVFEALFTTKKKAYDDRIEAEKEAERVREIEAATKKLLEERDRKLLSIAGVYFDEETSSYILKCLDFPDASNKLAVDTMVEADEAQFNAYVEEFISTQSENEKYIEKQKIENERLVKEKAEAEAKAKEREEKMRAEQEAKLAEEKKAREKVEAELKAKKEAEAKAEQEAKEKREKEAKAKLEQMKAPKKEQLSAWVQSMTIPQAPLADNETAKLIESKFNLFKAWAISEIEKM